MEMATDLNVEIRHAKPHDCGDVALLLKQAGLPIADIDSALAGFWVALHDGVIVGTVGVEILGDMALLRSLAVRPQLRSKEIGTRLFEEAVQHVRLQEVNTLFLLTTTAEDYFARRGFERVKREQVPKEIRTHEQFTSLCPDTAVVMLRRL